MVSTPPATPVTVPPATVADELLLLHAPLVAVSERAITDPAQTTDGPEIEPAVSVKPIVTILVAEAEPQVFTMVYEIVSIPGITPTSIPVPEMVALELLALHVPPEVVSTSVVNAPAQTRVVPIMVPPPGDALIVITLVAVAVPQPLVTA
jgi:hypothetical protein